MKVLTTIEERDNEGLLALIGKRVTFFCLNYSYTGTLVGVNDKDVKLADAAVVYETGAFTDKAWKDAQKLPKEWYLRTATIESYGELKE